MSKLTIGTVICAAAIAVASNALAHATLETREAAAGTTYKAVVRIGHGCDGEATNRVSISIPEGVIAVKPMPKAGWTLETVKGNYAGTYNYYGRTLTGGVNTIVWSGKLLDEHYDEFVFRAYLAKDLASGAPIYFPTVQECANGKVAWDEIPAEGQDPHDLDGPAPGLMITGGEHHHH